MKLGYWHLGADFVASASGVAERNELPSLLMVGTMEPRKGHGIVLDAFDYLWEHGHDIELRIAGKPGWNTEHLVERVRTHPEFGKRLHWYDRADDSQLVDLYRSCTALIAASYAEGFGLPIVEAGHFGKPVIASDISVFREVAGRAQKCWFFDVGSSSSLAQTIVSAIKEPLSAYKDENVGDSRWLSWAESAEDLCEVILDGNWYKTYEPDDFDPLAPLANLGNTIISLP